MRSLVVIILAVLLVDLFSSSSNNLFYHSINNNFNDSNNSVVSNISNKTTLSHLKNHYLDTTFFSDHLTKKKQNANQKLHHTKKSFQNKQITIYFDNFGFDPNEVTVPFGYKILFKNISNLGSIFVQAVNWNGYPIANSIFNLGQIGENQEKTITINQKGVWQYEVNHNPSYRAELGIGHNLSVKSFMDPNGTINGNQINIVYDIYGFMPNKITVPIGERVNITNLTNNSQPGPMFFEEAPNQSIPAPFLNLGVIDKKQTKSFIANLKGSWQFMDPYQPNQKNHGQITVD
jgi:plastocyanin